VTSARIVFFFGRMSERPGSPAKFAADGIFCRAGMSRQHPEYRLKASNARLRRDAFEDGKAPSAGCECMRAHLGIDMRRLIAGGGSQVPASCLC